MQTNLLGMIPQAAQNLLHAAAGVLDGQQHAPSLLWLY
jgi:hypothetical protein